ncbi:hypothetical protein ACGFR8_07580 [Streptomyces brevispora]|uniref:hypothetical protein n=1 Tax=Streptomyces brevispora TaxID=887462 RepID=UPI003722A7AA
MALGSPYRAQTDHKVAAASAREQPGTWVLAGLYSTTENARAMARGVQSGHANVPFYSPAGSFEAYAAPAGEERALWVRYMGGDRPVPPFPDRMTVRVCDRGSGREYVGVRVVTLTISTLCPTCGGPRGWDVVRHNRFCEDGEWYSVDQWDNPCGHMDLYAAILREARETRFPPAAAPVPLVQPVDATAGPVTLIRAAAKVSRRMHAKQSALLLREHGYEHAAELVLTELHQRRGRMSARQAADFLTDLNQPAASVRTSIPKDYA